MNFLRSDWRSLLLVVGIALVNSLSFQGSRGIFESTEGRYAECARETMLSGDYDDPILDGHAHWSKPPLTYVAIMAGIRTFGSNPWGVRACLVVAMILAAAAVWWAGAAIWGPTAGRWAGIVFATSPFVAGAAHAISSDMLTTLWVALAIAAFWHSRSQHSRWASLWMWGFLGLGCMTKGPPALLVPVVSLSFAWLFLRNVGARAVGAWTTLAGLAVFLGVGLSWYLWEAAVNRGLAAYWIGQEMVARNMTDDFHRNPSFHFVLAAYLPILLFGTGPWLPLVLFRWRGWRALLAQRSGEALTWNDAARWSLIGGVIIPFAAFSLSRSKLSLYLAPLFVPLCLVLGRGMEILLAQGRLQRRTAAWTAALLLLCIVVAKAAVAIPEWPMDMTRLASRLTPILARVQPDALYSAGIHPLHGLEFHLQRAVGAVDPNVVRVHMLIRKHRNEHTPFYVIRKTDWTRIGTNFPSSTHIEEMGPCWVGIWPAPEDHHVDR